MTMRKRRCVPLLTGFTGQERTHLLAPFALQAAAIATAPARRREGAQLERAQA
jgi:hypothetical protein